MATGVSKSQRSTYTALARADIGDYLKELKEAGASDVVYPPLVSFQIIWRFVYDLDTEHACHVIRFRMIWFALRLWERIRLL